jgi:hypothetical protein
MGSLQNHYSACRKILCLAAKRRETITYASLASKLSLKSPRQEWSTVLDPISIDEVQKTGRDLTLVVVYASGPAKGLSRYFSNVRGGQAPQTAMLDPRNSQQVDAYKQELEKVFDAYANANC